MSYWKPLLVLFIVLFIIGCVVLYFLTAPPVPSSTPPVQTAATSSYPAFGQSAQGDVVLPNQGQSPTEFTASFYTWYLQGLINDQRFVVSNQFKSAIGEWLTQDFASQWNAIAENTGSDPVLLAQDYQNSWVANIQTVVEDQTATTTVVALSLGTPSELQTMLIHLVPFNSEWRISTVTPGP